jgi:hypothetical protein
MKKSILALTILFVCAFTGCYKNTYNTNNIPVEHQPAFIVQGLQDIDFVPFRGYNSLNLTIEYRDSIQERVNLELSPLPAGVSITDGWVKAGYPTFESQLTFIATDTLFPPAPGNYPITLKATGAITGTKRYTFYMNIADPDTCAKFLFRGFDSCVVVVGGGPAYADSIYQDKNIKNKVWFVNFANTNKLVAGIFMCDNNTLIIPQQIIDGDTLSGMGYTVGVQPPFVMRLYARHNGIQSSIKM